MLNQKKRNINEKKFGKWTENQDGSRKYYYEVSGKQGWKAKYVKEVDKNEVTLKFFQEIYNENGILVEIHEKYLEDKGHKEA